METNKQLVIKTFKLEQITPMIHFQHYEDGACLRPSEVKPKLDNFINKWCQEKEINIPDSWYIDTENKSTINALNYKMRIKGVGDRVKNNTNPHKLYFGNLGKKEEEKIKTVYYPNGMEMTIVSFCKETILHDDLCGNKTLLEVITFVLPAFFKLHCFGARSRKGFGSFILAESKCHSEEYYGLFCPRYYYIQYENDVRSIVGKIMNDIWVISGMMKSGFNLTNKTNERYYYKGSIFKYYSEKNIGSDKAFIKQNVLKWKDDNKGDQYQEYRFTRAMLGLPQNYKYKKGVDTVEIKIENKEKKIERFASPVLFKPHGKRLYIIPQNIPDEMYDTEFTFSKKGQNTQDNNKIKTPTKDEFNLIDYLDWFMERYNCYLNKEHKNLNEAIKPTIKNKRIIKKVEHNPSKEGVNHEK